MIKRKTANLTGPGPKFYFIMTPHVEANRKPTLPDVEKLKLRNTEYIHAYSVHMSVCLHFGCWIFVCMEMAGSWGISGIVLNINRKDILLFLFILLLYCSVLYGFRLGWTAIPGGYSFPSVL